MHEDAKKDTRKLSKEKAQDLARFNLKILTKKLADQAGTLEVEVCWIISIWA